MAAHPQRNGLRSKMIIQIFCRTALAFGFRHITQVKILFPAHHRVVRAAEGDESRTVRKVKGERRQLDINVRVDHVIIVRHDRSAKARFARHSIQ